MRIVKTAISVVVKCRRKNEWTLELLALAVHFDFGPLYYCNGIWMLHYLKHLLLWKLMLSATSMSS